MDFLFVHNNFPAQFQFCASELASNPGHTVAAVGSQTSQSMSGIRLERYFYETVSKPDVHPFARRFEQEAQRAEQIIYALVNHQLNGLEPDVIVVHSGWGEAMPIRAIYPNSRIIAYSEYCYQVEGGDIGFDKEFPAGGIDSRVSLLAKNAAQVLALVDADQGLSPTNWQRSTFPTVLQNKIEVIHEGVDTDYMFPDANSRFTLPSGLTLSREAEVVTFVARNLEPMRGYHIFMRALPKILRDRPRAQVLIVGGDDVSYGPSLADGASWKARYLEEVQERVDMSRIHFLGNVPYHQFATLLKISSVHIYLTYPFVLSWSLVEAMSCECVIIASDTAPVREVIEHGKNGLLVPFFDVDQLTLLVITVLSRQNEFIHLGHAARRTVLERYDRTRVCLPRLLKLLEG